MFGVTSTRPSDIATLWHFTDRSLCLCHNKKQKGEENHDSTREAGNHREVRDPRG